MELTGHDVGVSLRARRRLLRMSQAQVAFAAGKTQAQVSDLERGAEDARLSTVLQIARSLGADILVIPNRLVPAVMALVDQRDEPRFERLVGNDPEDVQGGPDD